MNILSSNKFSMAGQISVVIGRRVWSNDTLRKRWIRVEKRFVRTKRILFVYLIFTARADEFGLSAIERTAVERYFFFSLSFLSFPRLSLFLSLSPFLPVK